MCTWYSNQTPFTSRSPGIKRPREALSFPMRSCELAAHAETGIFSQQQRRKDQRVCSLLNYLAETFPAIPTPLPSFPLPQPTHSCQTASGKSPPIRKLANSITHSLSEALLLAEFPRTGRLTSELDDRLLNADLKGIPPFLHPGNRELTYFPQLSQTIQCDREESL